MPAPVSRLQQLMLSELVRQHEERHGLLPDAAAIAAARNAGADLATQIQIRALSLADAGGQFKFLERWFAGARAAFVVLMAFAVVSGVGFAVAALGDGGRSVNLAWALGCLLGLNLISLLLWVVTLLTAGLLRQPLAGGILSRVWIAISGRLGGQLGFGSTPSLTELCHGRTANRWLFAVLTHLWWLLALTSAAIVLLGLLVIRRYNFVWETTLLTAETFVVLTQSLGAIPSLLGFAVPDETAIRAASEAVNTGQARHAWSGWLLGVLIVYGVLPRLMLALVSAYRWRRSKIALGLNLTHPGYALLRERLAPSIERLGICDPEVVADGAGSRPTWATAPGGALCVAIELDETHRWPPALPAGVSDGGMLDTREERQALREQLARAPVERLLIVCDPRRSPDRGTLILIRELATGAQQTRIWLSAPTNTHIDPLRVEDWQLALKPLALIATLIAPWQWLTTGHD